MVFLQSNFKLPLLKLSDFFVLLGWVCCLSFLSFSHPVIVFFSSIIFVFHDFYIFVGFLIFSFSLSLILLSCLCSFIAYRTFRWLFWIICQAVCRSPFLWGQLLVLYHIPLVVSCFPDYLWALGLYFGVCTFEKIITPSSLYWLALSEKVLL